MPIAFEQVMYTYPCGQQPAVQDLTVRFPAGQRCALIGRNGCGKSTLLRLADGLLQPDYGRLYWQGVPLNYRAKSLRSLRQQVGLVFQDPEQQLIATTVEEDLSYGLCNLGLPNAEVGRLVQRALQDFDLLELADTPINHLSLGQKKRVAIADVMVLHPKLLLMDEPTAYLDPAQTRTLFHLLERIHTAGTTTVIATHDLEFVYAWAEWIMVMDRGRVVLAGETEAVFAQHDHLQSLGLGIPLAVALLQEPAAAALSTDWMRHWMRRRFES
ncbi:MAG: ABC transporter ATP-binding protein [Leptolyngbya sp. SIOISBB]|nr:ABC transporter ATP-binding protein [Leptolyngbya sp. SIOISBB]